MILIRRIFLIFTVLVIMIVLVASVTLKGGQLKCWPMTAHFQQPEPFPTCPGVTAHWNDSLLPRQKQNETLSVGYFFRINSTFYPWAVRKGLFNNAGPSGFRSASKAQNWCENTQCPDDVMKANESNCCLYYVNLHFCFSEPNIRPSPCHPWLQARGTIASYSWAQLGRVDTGTWISLVTTSSIFSQQHTLTLMAVFKLAGMVAALEGTLTRKHTTVCGDGQCEDGENCDYCQVDCGECSLSWTEVVIIIVSILGVLFVSLLLILMYYRRTNQIALSDETWIVEPSEIFTDEAGSRSVSTAHIMDNPKEKKPGIKYPTVSALVMPLHRTDSFQIRRIHLARVRGQQVVAKRYCNEDFELTPQIRKEVLDVRLLSHHNVCQFVGGTVQPQCVYILYEYCPKGSLIDILPNDTISLNWAFRFSILADVSHGMSYLHRHGMIHGNLKSSNCVVDDRWICKVTDFGLKEYRREIFSQSEEEFGVQYEQKLQQDQVYRAPEADVDLQPASDVFSFGIIMLEVANRERVTPRFKASPEFRNASLFQFPSSSSFCLESSTMGNKGNRTETVFRAQFQELIRKCWQDEPDDRPDFREVGEALLRMHPSKKNPVDTMMALMQMYSKNLEQIVEKRSRQLLEEKQKTEALLYSILPRPVADRLRNGRQVTAESYESSTVFFSDIVGFTLLSSRSTPMQIVDLLNKLYTTFDSIIERHNVYKVETIGDAYMVVSGVPKRTNQHALNVALMALEIVSASKQFVIPHLPTESLYVKAGFDSGPVCAGVVGIKMPRYCLFGDTVNTASRMEAYSKGGSIHVSGSSYRELEPSGQFQFEPRGAISVKGKGEMVTWWLRGLQQQLLAPDITCTPSFTAVKGSNHDMSFLPGAY